MEYLLNQDVISLAYPGHIYGKRGSKVKEIIVSGHVVIVEDKKGRRFPAIKNSLDPILK